jgi:hypothetical protein
MDLLCVINQQTKNKVMKKLIAIAAILFAFTSATKAQSTFYATSVSDGSYNTSTGQYEWTAARSANLRFTVSTSTISIDNEVHSTFHLGAQTLNSRYNDGTHAYQWNATDQNGVSCSVKITVYKDGSELMAVFYSDVAAAYAIPE